MRILAILLLISSCSYIEQDFHIDDGLTNYVDAFYREAESRGIHLVKDNLIVQYGDRSHSFKKGGQRIIEIERRTHDKFVNDGYYWSIESLVFHELGHALLNKDHTDHVSVMNYEFTFTPYLKSDCVKKLFYDELMLGKQIINRDYVRVQFQDCK